MKDRHWNNYAEAGGGGGGVLEQSQAIFFSPDIMIVDSITMLC